MNLIFISGKIVSNIEFKFIINSKKISMVNFLVELENKNIIKIKAYDKIADYIYRKINVDDNIIIYGRIEKNMVNVVEIAKF